MKTTPQVKVWLGLASLSLAACSIGDDSSPPVLSVELFWQTERQSPRTCEVAGVASMDFQLLDARGQEVVSEEDTSRGHACRDGFDFPDLPLGDYTLVVTGYDANQNAGWSGNCPLRLDRFDRLYDCNIYQTADGTTSGAEAGTGGSPVIAAAGAAAGTGTAGASAQSGAAGTTAAEPASPADTADAGAGGSPANSSR